jgi:hypothetical protein
MAWLDTKDNQCAKAAPPRHAVFVTRRTCYALSLGSIEGINQKDPEEKSQQVSIMQHIYKSATGDVLRDQ